MLGADRRRWRFSEWGGRSGADDGGFPVSLGNQQSRFGSVRGHAKRAVFLLLLVRHLLLLVRHLLLLVRHLLLLVRHLLLLVRHLLLVAMHLLLVAMHLLLVCWVLLDLRSESFSAQPILRRKSFLHQRLPLGMIFDEVWIEAHEDEALKDLTI